MIDLLTDKELDTLQEIAKKATKAPWSFSNFEIPQRSNIRVIKGGDNYSIAMLMERKGEENIANASLMKDARRLLDSLLETRQMLYAVVTLLRAHCSDKQWDRYPENLKAGVDREFDALRKELAEYKQRLSVPVESIISPIAADLSVLARGHEFLVTQNYRGMGCAFCGRPLQEHRTLENE